MTRLDEFDPEALPSLYEEWKKNRAKLEKPTEQTWGTEQISSAPVVNDER